jgi:hypothetical protein
LTVGRKINSYTRLVILFLIDGLIVMVTYLTKISSLA